MGLLLVVKCFLEIMLEGICQPVKVEPRVVSYLGNDKRLFIEGPHEIYENVLLGSRPIFR